MTSKVILSSLWLILGILISKQSIAGDCSSDETCSPMNASEADRTVASLPPVVQPPDTSPIKFSGFVDVWLSNYSQDAHSGTSGSPESGFALQDGALYLNYKKDAISFLLDVPFRRYKNSDAGISINPNSSPNSKILFGADKAQAYIRYTSPYNFDVVLGQFDTIYGVEVNDSKDRTFSKTGLLYDYMLPVTHTGTMISYTDQGVYARILAADSNNKGSLGDSSTGDNNYEYGTAIGFSNDLWRAQVGYLSRPINKASGVGGGARTLLDGTLGVTMGKLSLDTEYAVLSDSSKNTLTSSDSSDKEKEGVGFLMLGIYSLSEKWSLGVRFEHVENDPGQIGDPRQDSYGLNVHYKWISSFESRLEFIQYRYRQVANPGEALTDNRLLLSNIFSL